nr:MAG TPA: hypothetical protein [Caudoviricetes sp.]
MQWKSCKETNKKTHLLFAACCMACCILCCICDCFCSNMKRKSQKWRP